MAVKIRMTRVGRKNGAMYRVVVADQRFARDGRTIESVGYYHPQEAAKKPTLKMDRISYWIEKGAKPTATVAKLIKRLQTSA